MAEFKPIAMRCNQQQYAEIKQILIDNGFTCSLDGTFTERPYLTNNFNSIKNNINNSTNDLKSYYNRTIFETWNKDTFLEYCGITNKKLELTELPNVWYVQLTEDNKDIVKNWHESLTNTDYQYKIGAYYGLSNNKPDSWGENHLPKNSNVITTEQFKKWVLKETTPKINTQWMPQIGDWVFTDMCNVKDALSKETCVKVRRIDLIPDEQPNFLVETESGGSLWCYPSKSNTSFVRKAEPHEIPNGKVPELLPPDYVEAVRSITGIEKGKIYPFVNGCVIDGRYNNYEMPLNEGCSYFKPSTKEAFDAQNNKTKYIVGKWYKFSSYSENTNVNYAKLKELDNAFTASDWIINKIYEGTAKWSLDHIFNPVLLTDLSEIQEYLPDNHPDKQNNILNIDKILEEAKLKYPIGTQFQPAHVISGLNVVTAEDYYWENDRKDSILVTSDSLKENWTGCLYKNGKWATIMEPVKPVEPKSKYRIAAEKAMKKFSDIKIGDLYITTNGDKYKATRLPEIVADSNEDCYIDCGPGYLWKYETPHKVGYKVIKSLTPIEETPIISLNDLYESPSMFHALDYKETLKEIQPTESITNQLLNIKLNNY